MVACGAGLQGEGETMPALPVMIILVAAGLLIFLIIATWGRQPR